MQFFHLSFIIFLFHFSNQIIHFAWFLLVDGATLSRSPPPATQQPQSVFSIQLPFRSDFCRQEHLTRHFSPVHCTRFIMCITPHGSRTCLCASPHPILMVIHDVRLIDRLFLSLFLSVCLSYPLLFSSHLYLYSVLNLLFHVDGAEAINHCHFAKGGVLPLAEFTPPTGYEPKLHDDDHRESALFTTVHSGARRTSGPKTSLSLS